MRGGCGQDLREALKFVVSLTINRHEARADRESARD
jgi:hypothetical protein